MLSRSETSDPQLVGDAARDEPCPVESDDDQQGCSCRDSHQNDLGQRRQPALGAHRGGAEDQDPGNEAARHGEKDQIVEAANECEREKATAVVTNRLEHHG
jgi:hypothetical protein